MGGLRFKLEQDGAFLNSHQKMATPPWTSLRELEYASLQLEKEDAINDPAYAKSLGISSGEMEQTKRAFRDLE